MTETQAKSGASGASTDAPDSGQRDSASRADAPTDAAGAATTAARDTDRDTESPSGSARLESPTNVIRSAPSTSSASTIAAADEKSAPAGSSAGTYTPRAAATTPTPTPVPTSPAVPGGAAGRLTDPEPTVRTSTSVPVVGVPPIKVAPSAVSASSTGRTTTASPGAGTGAIGGTAAGTSATGRASVVPTAPKTTVTGTGLRQTSGATSVVGAPARPGAAAVGAARVSDTLRSARATVTGAASRGPRRARLHLKRIDPWSVMKFSFAVSLVLFVVAIVATSVLYLALDAMNVFDSINKAFAEVTGQNGTGTTGGFKITAKGVIGTAVLLGAVNMVLFTALATLGSFVYNVCADLVGGVELTLSEKE